MDAFVECVGDPRAMGQCQGLAYRTAIQACVGAAGAASRRSRLPSLRALTSGPSLGRGTGREIVRHYTHLAERMAGIARNADVPFSSLIEVFCRSTHGAAPEEELVASALAVGAQRVEELGSGPLVVRTLVGSRLEDSPWILRKSRPDVGFASAEITLPWLAAAVAGINEAGVAVAMVPRSASYGGGVNAGSINMRHAPHAVLLVQECLQRFEDLAGCLDWCRKRPRSGNVSLIIADAQAQLAQIEIEGPECRIVELGSGIALDGASREIDQKVRAYFQRHQRIDLAAICSIGDPTGELAVWLEPARRRLSIRLSQETGSAAKAIEIAL